ncbi:alpha/beta fold hydrolase [Prauserella rugosa]|uniref:Alpha/beta hydrolase family protein n=1 Tax=Prauserella rugosa TaxID=43354 RepID=A0A660CKW5_9PSEU|nr:alpha/beta fold hydrolase [Prauserella rugosa]TWH22273.1 alpha/beta hydrolase family protein [Prauserella rugosa]
MRTERAWKAAERYDFRIAEAGDGARIAYVRPAPSNDTPVVLLPGGPGLASVFVYDRLRKLAVSRGLDVLMMEHRGIGLSRMHRDDRELTVPEVTVEAAADDLAVVLDREGIDRAVVYGTSYGSYLAQLFGVRHPGRVAGMVLDSPVLSAADRFTVRDHRRELLLHGRGRLPTLVRAVLAAGPGTDGADRAEGADEPGRADDVDSVDDVGNVVQVVHEFAGPETLERLLEAHLHRRARRTWRWLASLGAGEREGRNRPFVAEFDLVAGITHGTLGFGAAPDGLPLDPQKAFAAAAAHPDAPPFRGDPVDLPAALPTFGWPTAVVSGGRDLRTPRPIADRAVSLLPHATLVDLPGVGHSAMDTHQLAALHVAHHVRLGDLDGLARRSRRIEALPRRGPSGILGPAIRTAVRLAH